MCEAEPSLNLTPEREEILELLKADQREMNSGEIAQTLGKEQSNVSHLLKGLKGDGLICNPKFGYYQIVSSSTEPTATN
jgi:DNA-binding transcriptional ArsR family regulator